MSLRSLSSTALPKAAKSFVESPREAIMRGAGLHTGLEFEVTFKAAAVGSGIHFRVPYQGDLCEAPALWTRLSGTTRATALVLRGPQGKRVELRTIEHLLAALWPFGNLDLQITVTPFSAPEPTNGLFEIPILDGSAELWSAFFETHARMLFRTPSRNLRAWQVVESCQLSQGEKTVDFEPLPNSVTEFKVAVDFGSGLAQNVQYVADWWKPASETGSVPKSFRSEIASARTFGFKTELEDLYRRGLAKGGTMHNAILLDGATVVNPEGFRMSNELARHKLLDAIGDFALLGAPILGKLTLVRGGHSMHLFALKEAVDRGVLRAGVLNLDTGTFLPDPL